jgi:hypothetical protein
MRVEFARHKKGDNDSDENEVVHGIIVMSCLRFR